MATIALIQGFFHGGRRWQEAQLGSRVGGRVPAGPALRELAGLHRAGLAPLL